MTSATGIRPEAPRETVVTRLLCASDWPRARGAAEGDVAALTEDQRAILAEAETLYRRVLRDARLALSLASQGISDEALQDALREQARGLYREDLAILALRRGWLTSIPLKEPEPEPESIAQRETARPGAVPSDHLRFPISQSSPSTGMGASGSDRGTTLIDDLPLGAEIAGRYLVEGRIGGGAMGAVFRARHRVTDSRVALKLIPVKGQESQARFLREARSLGRLRHPHIVQVHDAGEALPGVLYLALDFIEGETISARVRREGAFSRGLWRSALAEILRAVGQAHRQGVVHRDLKGDNIMLESENTAVKILDFGIAKLSGPESGGFETMAGQICGTPAYISPEQASGGEVTPLSDLYAIGVLAYEMATGRLPFVSETSLGFLGQHLLTDPDPPSSLRPEISAAHDAWILRLLAKNPKERFPSAEAALEELERS